MKRYTQIMKGRQGDYMAESPTGEWVEAADVEAVEAERDAYKKQCECRYCKGRHLNISVCSKCAFAGTNTPHFIQQAHALAAKDEQLALYEATIYDNGRCLGLLNDQLAAKEAVIQEQLKEHCRDRKELLSEIEQLQARVEELEGKQ